METKGFTVERSSTGRPTSVHIDLLKYPFFIPILEENGFEIEPQIKWTAKMKKAFSESENGETVLGDINNFWDV